MHINFLSDLPKHYNTLCPSIFLAGPTYRNTLFGFSWRSDAISYLTRLGFDGALYIPETAPKDEDTYDYGANVNVQIEREWKCLSLADAIVFWMPRNMKDLPGLTSNIEMGYWMSQNPDKVVLGYPLNAEKMKYIDYLYRHKTKREPYHDFEATLKAGIEMAERRFRMTQENRNTWEMNFSS